MLLSQEQRAILDRLQFIVPPVGSKFLVRPPDGVDRLGENLALCEMLKRAQEGNAFFADAANHACEAGQYILGQTDAAPAYLSGQFGAGLKIFDGERAASRLYQYIPKLSRGVVNCVALAPLGRLTFDPDVLIALADTRQTEILLRAMSYRTGQMWSSKYSSAIGCAWLFVYPYLTGELNYISTGFGHGMKRRKLFPEGMHLVSIPFDRLASILETLREMPWVPPALEPDGPEFVRRLMDDLGLGKKKT